LLICESNDLIGRSCTPRGSGARPDCGCAWRTTSSSRWMEGLRRRAGLELAAAGKRLRKRFVQAAEALTAPEAQVAKLGSTRLSNSEIGSQPLITPSTGRVPPEEDLPESGHQLACLASGGYPQRNPRGRA
jgi:hypothetical protein